MTTKKFARASEQVLICDLDGTLYDWVSYFVPTFYSMVDAVVRITGCDREKLLDDLREVHQRHADTEQPFALLETDTVRQLYAHASRQSVIARLDPAFHAFNSARKKHLKLGAHVRKTLDILDASGVKLIAHTESKLYGVVDRLNRLDLFRYFSTVYCRERSRSPHPNPRLGVEWLARVPKDKIVELSRHQAKPDPAVLLEICEREGAKLRNVSYVGDSVARDILMAKRAKVFSIWAAYGAHHSRRMYGKLLRISHWTNEEIMREKRLTEEAECIQPDYVAHKSFAEVLTAIGINQ